jgi:hypothetical protein
LSLLQKIWKDKIAKLKQDIAQLAPSATFCNTTFDQLNKLSGVSLNLATQAGFLQASALFSKDDIMAAALDIIKVTSFESVTAMAFLLTAQAVLNDVSSSDMSRLELNICRFVANPCRRKMHVIEED